MSLLHIFAKNVQAIRTSKGLSQEKLAELAELHRTYISAVEREKRNISIENIEKIASALDVEPYILLKIIRICQTILRRNYGASYRYQKLI